MWNILFSFQFQCGKFQALECFSIMANDTVLLLVCGDVPLEGDVTTLFRGKEGREDLGT